MGLKSDGTVVVVGNGAEPELQDWNLKSDNIATPSPSPIPTPAPIPTPPSGDDSSAGASDWAVAEIDEAISLGIIPEELLNNYQTNITRAEFCKTVIRMLMVKSGTFVNEERFVSAFGINLSEEPFTDTSDRYIKIAYALQIVNGIGNNRFAPNDPITRQESAAMLGRAASVFEFTSYTNSSVNFTDEGAIAAWAKEPVNFVSANSIMQGTGNNMFSPHDTYTREQAILTMLQLFKAFPREYYSV